jgi:hypothetical protein
MSTNVKGTFESNNKDSFLLFVIIGIFPQRFENEIGEEKQLAFK